MLQTRISLSLLLAFLLGMNSAFGQQVDNQKFHFQIPIGVQYVTSATWKPYRVNYGVGLSFMHRLHQSNWSIDWGLTAALTPQKDTTHHSGTMGDPYEPPDPGSELASFYAGIGQRRLYENTLLQYAVGFTYLYSGFTPFYVATPYQARSFLGAYVLCGLQFQLSSSFLMGPIASFQVYPSSTKSNIGLNASNVFLGVLIGPAN